MSASKVSIQIKKKEISIKPITENPNPNPKPVPDPVLEPKSDSNSNSNPNPKPIPDSESDFKPDSNPKIPVLIKKKEPETKDLNLDPNSELVISFDVGIENLAYCILSINPHTNTVRWIPEPVIHEWGLINLIPEILTEYPCCGKLKTDLPCKSRATKFYGFPVNRKTYCNLHLPRIEQNGTNTVHISEIPNTLKCSHLKGKNQELCGIEAFKYTINNQGYLNGRCKYHLNEQYVHRYITAKNATEYEIKSTLFQKLRDLKILQRYPKIKIIIEHQPDITREMMRIISYAIYDYYLIESYHLSVSNDLLNQDGLLESRITYIDPKHKLLMYDGTESITCTIKDPHGRNKRLGILYAEHLLKSYNLKDKLEFFNSNTKKDDLADSLLMGMYYLTCYLKGVIPSKNASVTKQKYQSNLLKFQKIRSVKPSDKIILNGKYTLSNLKYFHKHPNHPLCLQHLNAITQALIYYLGEPKFPV